MPFHFLPQWSREGPNFIHRIPIRNQPQFWAEGTLAVNKPDTALFLWGWCSGKLSEVSIALCLNMLKTKFIQIPLRVIKFNIFQAFSHVKAVFILGPSSPFVTLQMCVAALPSLGIRPHLPAEGWGEGLGEPGKVGLHCPSSLLSSQLLQVSKKPRGRSQQLPAFYRGHKTRLHPAEKAKEGK